MGGCYSATKGMRKENATTPAPKAMKEEADPKSVESPQKETTLEVAKPSEEEATLIVSMPKEEQSSEVVTTSLKEEITSDEMTIISEMSLLLKDETASKMMEVPLKDATIEVASTPKEGVTDKVIVLTEKTTTMTVTCHNEDPIVKEETGSEVTTEGNITTNEVNMEASMVNNKIEVKETKKVGDGEENKDGERVVDDSKVIEKKTLEEETGPNKVIESMKEAVNAIEEQESDR